MSFVVRYCSMQKVLHTNILEQNVLILWWQYRLCFILHPFLVESVILFLLNAALIGKLPGYEKLVVESQTAG